MGNNTGIIFGRVTDSASGAPVGDTDVSLNFVYGDPSLGAVRVGGDSNLKSYVQRVKTSSDGRYVLPFFWEAVDIGKVGEGSGTASVYAAKWGANNTHASNNARGRVYLVLDMKKLIGVGYPSTPESTPEAVNILKDFYITYRDLLPKNVSLYPTTPILTTELYGLCGRVDLSVGQPS